MPQTSNKAIKLKFLRKAAKISQKKMAKELEISQQSISHLEKGKIKSAKVKTLDAYAQALGGKLKVEIEIDGKRYPIF